MSMNIEIYGEREVKVLKTGSVETQRIYLDVWQTPTRISYEIQAAPNPLEKYFEWVMSRSTTTVKKVYHDFHVECDVDFGIIEDSPDLYEEQPYNSGEEHIKDVKAQIEVYEKLGYEFSVEVD